MSRIKILIALMATLTLGGSSAWANDTYRSNSRGGYSGESRSGKSYHLSPSHHGSHSAHYYDGHGADHRIYDHHRPYGHESSYYYQRGHSYPSYGHHRSSGHQVYYHSYNRYSSSYSSFSLGHGGHGASYSVRFSF